jgi:hypothetical protein
VESDFDYSLILEPELRVTNLSDIILPSIDSGIEVSHPLSLSTELFVNCSIIALRLFFLYKG